MKRKLLNLSYLSAFCLEVSLFLHAGISVSDGLHMLREDEHDRNARALLDSLFNAMEEGLPFSEAIEKAGVFPSYLWEMVMLAEKTGKLEDTMRGLSAYYERQSRLAANIKNAVFYPVILIAMMLIVIAVIVGKVLPIFNDVFHQMGVQMSSFAVNIMKFGQMFSGASTVIFVVICVLFALIVLFYSFRPIRLPAIAFFKNAFGGKGIFKKISSARFAFAMAMAIESGMDADEAVTMAARVAGGGAFLSKAETCKRLLAAGAKLGDALTQSDIFTSKNNRMLSFAQQTGMLPAVMYTVAERSEEMVRDEMDFMIIDKEMKELNLLNLSEAVKEETEQIKDAVIMMDYGKASEQIHKLLKNV